MLVLSLLRYKILQSQLLYFAFRFNNVERREMFLKRDFKIFLIDSWVGSWHYSTWIEEMKKNINGEDLNSYTTCPAF